MIGDRLIDQKVKQKKNYPQVSFGLRLFTTTHLKISLFKKEVSALSFALDHSAPSIWGAMKPVPVLNSHRSVTQFFQSKNIHPSPWKCLDRVLSFNTLLAHVPGKANSAAHFRSRMQTDPDSTLQINLTDHIPVRDNENEVEAKAPNVSLSSNKKVRLFQKRYTQLLIST